MIPSDTALTRVAIAAETITGGGLAHYTEDLDNALRTFARSHQEVMGGAFHSPLLTPGGSVRGRIKSSLKRIPLIGPLLRRLGAPRKPPAWAEANQWTKQWNSMPKDVIAIVPHVVFHDAGELDAYYAAIANRRFVLVIHDLHALHYPDQWRPADIERMKMRFTFLCSRASRIIVHNEFTAHDVAQKLGVDLKRISIVLLPAFFSEATFSASAVGDHDRLARMGIDKPYALWASSSTFSHKNHSTLLKAWRLIQERGHRIELVCTGAREPRWNIIKACIDSEHLQSAVRFTGIIGDKELATLLRNAHLAICPTLFEGGGPGPAAEAMMAGIPLTVSDIPQCRQLFNMRTDLCTFFDPYDPAAIADAVEEILHNYDKAAERARFARNEYRSMRTQQSAANEYWWAVEEAQREITPAPAN